MAVTQNMEFWEAAGLCSGIVIPGLLVCAPDETERNLQVPNLVCKFCVIVGHGFFLFVLNFVVNTILLHSNRNS